MPDRRRPTIVILLAGVLFGHSALAHDHWLEPHVTRATTGPGAHIDARLFVGEAPSGDEEKPFERARLSRLELWSRNGRTDLLPLGIEGATPFIATSGQGEGEFLFALERTPVLIELTPEKFEPYLRDEGLTAIVKERATRGESHKPGRERYTRHVKALVVVGDPAARAMAEQPVGQRLELLVDAHGHEVRAAQPFDVRVRFEGRPLAGARVQASLRRGPGDAGAGALDVSAISDARGIATLMVGSAGFLVLHLVHMRRCFDAGAPCKDADWESFWGSFSLSIQ